MEMPTILPGKYRRWGRPVTYQRYASIFNHLLMLANQRRGRSNYQFAVSDWEADAQWMKVEFEQLAMSLKRYGFRSYCPEPEVCSGIFLMQKRSTDARMSFAGFVHRNGFGLSLWRSTKLVMAMCMASRLRWTPRLIWRSVSSAKKRSCLLIHEALVGVKWTCPKNLASGAAWPASRGRSGSCGWHNCP